MDSKDVLWLSRGEALGRLLSENRRVPPSLAEAHPVEFRPTIDPLADPLEAARFSASIALAMRNGALRKGKEARAAAMRAAFHGLMRALRRPFAGQPGTTVATPMPAVSLARRRTR